jgi:hypothetical protein
VGVIIQPKLLKSTQAPGGSIKNTAKSPQKQIPIKDIHNWEEVVIAPKLKGFKPSYK